MKLCFDIDGVLFAGGLPPLYDGAEPIMPNIELVNECFDAGHTIIIFTARGSETHDNHVVESTQSQLKAAGVKHHVLLFGKPNADWYVDDRTIPIDMLRGIL